MNLPNAIPLTLGLVIFSFLINAVLIVPFIDLLYRMKLTRRKEAPKTGKVPLFDKLHDVKAGTPVGGGILVILTTVILFLILYPLATRMGVMIQTSFNPQWELFIIIFTFLSFGLLGFADDIVKIFGKGQSDIRPLGIVYGLSRRTKFALQWVLALFIGFLIYNNLGVKIIHIPIVGSTLNLGWWYVPFSAFVIVSFTNAVNITDGLDGLVSGLLLICLAAFIIITAGNLDTPLSLFIALWIGGLIAFLYFNVYPARVFLGDTGALAFGAMLAVIGLLTGSLIALLVIGGIFVLEILSSAIQIFGWKFLKKPIFPMAPMHHAFLASGWPEPKIVMRAWLTGVILAIFGLWLATI
jgi:phospho-N-acetylmuramoyl-pentapeptide-transferase